MVEALGAIGDPAAGDALVARLRGDAYVPVRAAAARALAAVGDRAAVPALEQAARRETEPMVAAAAREAARAEGTAVSGRTRRERHATAPGSAAPGRRSRFASARCCSSASPPRASSIGRLFTPMALFREWLRTGTMPHVDPFAFTRTVRARPSITSGARGRRAYLLSTKLGAGRRGGGALADLDRRRGPRWLVRHLRLGTLPRRSWRSARGPPLCWPPSPSRRFAPASTRCCFWPSCWRRSTRIGELPAPRVAFC